MKMTTWGILAAAAMLSTSANAAEATLVVNDVRLAVPLPTGYCLPTGQDKLVADTLAKGDKDNVTLATLIRCDQMGRSEGPGNDYMLIKSPLLTLTSRMARGALLDSLKAEFGKAEWQSGTASQQATQNAAKGLSDALDTPLELSGDLAPRGTDADCAYLGGTLNVNAGGTTYPIILGGCITSVGEKAIMVFSYDDPGKGGGVAGKMRKAHDVAMSIKVAP